MRIGKYKKLGAVATKYKVADKQNDVRGWVVVGANGHKVGYIDELIVDTRKKKVQFLDILLNIAFSPSEGKHILVPIELATIYSQKKVVCVNHLSTSLVNSYPSYTGVVDDGVENKIRDFLAGNLNAKNMLTDQLSPKRLDNVANEIRLESDSDLIMRLKKERDMAVAERDLLLDENLKLRKTIEKYENTSEPETEKEYKSGLTDCDDIDTGRKC